MLSALEFKVGSGFTLLLYWALVIGYALYMKTPFPEVVPWLAGGAAGQIGQRAVTQISTNKTAAAVTIAEAEAAKSAPCPPEEPKP